eukprot:TRINITY_DN32058_c0_g1_i1.p1 TRINITY_DN32058_c0_g1~~TRINITY_DN32058_c0_g1_i1.p1  ORF type:complete len:256 (-),score=26.68 TRINITY_DN32058_c0_g1_i1:146-913(-)
MGSSFEFSSGAHRASFPDGIQLFSCCRLGPMASTPPQQSTWHFVVPIFAAATVCIAPALVLLTLTPLATGDNMKREARWLVERPLCLVSVLILILSCVLLLSNHSVSSTYLFGVYGALLAVANLVAERMRRKRAWPLLLIWHFFNLLNLLGGASSALQPYEAGSGGRGLLSTILTISAAELGGSCDRSEVDWCNDGWITCQILAAFAFVIAHIIAFFIIGTRTLHYYGGDEGSDGPTCRESAASHANGGRVEGPF